MTQSENVISRDACERWLPHRGRNMVIDQATIHEAGMAGRSEGELTIVPGDDLGRDLFLYEVPGVGPCINPAILLEHMALLGLITLQLDQDKLSFFSRVRKARFTERIRAGDTLRSKAGPRNAPKPFLRFTTEVDVADKKAVSSDIMAFIGTVQDLDEALKDVRQDAPEQARDAQQIAEYFPGRDPNFVFVDRAVSITDAGQTGLFSYFYPTDHPLTEGHFPQRPLMMGVTQLLAIQDAAQWMLWDLRRAGQLPAGQDTAQVAGELVDADGTQVCSVDMLKLRLFEDSPVTELVELRMVSFRKTTVPPRALRVQARITL